MNPTAAGVLTYSLAGDFDPDRLDPACRAIYADWIRRSEDNGAWLGEVFGMARVLIWERRRAGHSEGEIAEEFLGHAFDQASRSSLPANRGGAAPRDEFLAMMDAVFAQAMGYEDDDFSSWEGDELDWSGEGWPDGPGAEL
jgi:hypothetical protein